MLRQIDLFVLDTFFNPLRYYFDHYVGVKPIYLSDLMLVLAMPFMYAFLFWPLTTSDESVSLMAHDTFCIVASIVVSTAMWCFEWPERKVHSVRMEQSPNPNRLTSVYRCMTCFAHIVVTTVWMMLAHASVTVTSVMLGLLAALMVSVFPLWVKATDAPPPMQDEVPDMA